MMKSCLVLKSESELESMASARLQPRQQRRNSSSPSPTVNIIAHPGSKLIQEAQRT